MAARRGRLHQVPEDHTSLVSQTPDVEARVAWLMQMSRLHHPDPNLPFGDAFTVALREVGVTADRSQVSRWESGRTPATHAVLRAYEQVLGFSDGQLTAPANVLRWAYQPRTQRVMAPVLDPDSPNFHRRLDELFAAVTAGTMTGPLWTELGHHLSAVGHVYAPAEVWETAGRTLTSEIARGVGVAYMQRFEAMQILLENRSAHAALVRAVGEFVAPAAAQVVNDPMSVLEASPLPEASDIALRQLLTATWEHAADSACMTVANKIRSGHFTSGQIRTVERYLAERLQRPGTTSDRLVQLLSVMPDDARQRLVTASSGAAAGLEHLTQAESTGEDVGSRAAQAVVDRLTELVSAQVTSEKRYEEDKMLPRLLREALFATDFDRAHYSSLLLAACPYRPLVAKAIGDEVDRIGFEHPVAGRLSRLIPYVAGAPDQARLMDWCRRAPAAVARPAALGLGHADDPATDVRGLADCITGDQPLLDRAMLYALGMRRSPMIDELADDVARPERIRLAAQWWQQVGGAVHV